jgi:putative acyl-CoA dehydrogenase
MKSSDHERLLARVATPAAKYFNCSRAADIANEALQCHGGNGFIEENPMARVYREAPLNSVWEGTANMMCMDVRRAMLRDQRTIDALFDEMRPLKGQDGRFADLLAATERLVGEAVRDEFFARPMTEAVARALQAAELMRHSSQEVVDAFLNTRSPAAAGGWGSMFGTMGVTIDKRRADRIVERANVFR